MLPTSLGAESHEHVLPPAVREQTLALRHFVCENLRTSRRYLSGLGMPVPIEELRFYELTKHTPPERQADFLEAIEQGHDVGMLSEAGCPGVADPGAELAKLAHERGVEVMPMVGPSSLLLALMASGLNGQRFAFGGYLPIDKGERARAIQQHEARSRQWGETQIFIETPFRNDKLLEELARLCAPSTRVCVAVDLSLPSQWIQTRPAPAWKRDKPELHKRPAVFLLLA